MIQLNKHLVCEFSFFSEVNNNLRLRKNITSIGLKMHDSTRSDTQKDYKWLWTIKY